MLPGGSGCFLSLDAVNDAVVSEHLVVLATVAVSDLRVFLSLSSTVHTAHAINTQ